MIWIMLAIACLLLFGVVFSQHRNDDEDPDEQEDLDEDTDEYN